MGYNIYLCYETNERLEKLKKISNHAELHNFLFNNKEYDKDDCYISLHDYNFKKLYDFGKYIEWTEKLNKENIFENEEFNKYVSNESDFFIINKNGLEYIIEDYHKDMEKYYLQKWALSSFLEILINKDKTQTQRWVNACDVIYNDKEYNKFKFDLDLNHTLEELFKENNENYKNIIDKSIKYLSNNISSYFRISLEEYQRKNNPFYNLNEDQKFSITNSWNKDKVILELVHIYKTFDFQNNKLIIYGT